MSDDRNDWRKNARPAAPADDDRWCDLVRSRAQQARSSGHALTLDQLLSDVPPPSRTGAVLDGIIREVLRDRSMNQTREDAARELIREHPELASQIQLTLMLDEIVATSDSPLPPLSEPPDHGAPAELHAQPRQESLADGLPRAFGPIWRDRCQRYTLVERMVEGRRAHSFLAIDHARSSTSRGHTVVVKVLPSSNREASLLLAECARVARIDHPSVVRVIDAGEQNGSVYIACEHVDGTSLGAIALGRRPWGEREMLAIAEPLCAGLLAAHLAGVTHGDIHPFNVMVRANGQPTLIDFGLGRDAEERQRRLSADDGAPAGALGFIAPEMWRRLPDANPQQADVYALGSLMHWMLTGQPVNGRSAAEAVEFLNGMAGDGHEGAGMRLPLALRGVDGDIAEVIARAVSIDPSTRYSNAAEMLGDLRRLIAHEAIPWTKPGVLRQFRLALHRTPPHIRLLTLGGGILGVLLIGALVQSRLTATQSERDALEAKLTVSETARSAAEAKATANRVVEAQLAQLSRVGSLMRAMVMSEENTREAEWLPILTSLRDTGKPLGLDIDSLNALVLRRIDLLDRLPRIGLPKSFASPMRDDDIKKLGLEEAIVLAARGSWLLEARSDEEARNALAAAVKRLKQLLTTGDPFIDAIELRLNVATHLVTNGADEAAKAYFNGENIEARMVLLPESVLNRLMAVGYWPPTMSDRLLRRSNATSPPNK